MTQLDTYDASHSYKFVILKIQDGGLRHFETSKNRLISARSISYFNVEIWQVR